MLPNITKIEYLVRPFSIYPLFAPLFRKLSLWQWELYKSLPPPLPVKASLIREKAKKHGVAVCIETGTFFGDMAAFLEPFFQRLVSIELDVKLSELARERFRHNARITILCGDSGKVLPEVLKTLNEPALFWLDGHFSGGVTARAESDTPIVEELESIFSSQPLNHVILIDDARLFGTHEDYPSVAFIRDLVGRHRPHWTLTLADDVLCIEPGPMEF